MEFEKGNLKQLYSNRSKINNKKDQIRTNQQSSVNFKKRNTSSKKPRFNKLGVLFTIFEYHSY